jgi:hypothetical protein
MSEDTTGPRSFAVFVQQLGDGDLNSELSAAFHKLGRALQEESLARSELVGGTLALKLKAKCDPRGIVQFTWDVKVEPPKPKRVGASVWVDRHGRFVHENPRQKPLFPREVVVQDAEVREVDGGGAAASGREV